MPVKERPIVEEVGQTQRSAGWVLSLFFVAAVFLVPIVHFAWELATGNRVQEFDILKGMPTIENIKRYENALSDRAAAANAVRPGVQWAQLFAMNQGNEKVLVAQEGWLFYKTGLYYSTGPGFRTKYMLEGASAKHPDPLPAIIDFHRQLKERGIELVVVPTPTKAQIYPEKLDPSYDPSLGPPANVYEKEFVAELEKNGVQVLNLAPVLWEAKATGKLLYMPLDTHWTPDGMSIFANALAEDLKKRYPWLAQPVRKYVPRPLEVTNRGDLYDMLKLPAGAEMFPQYTFTVEQVEDEGSGEWAEPDGNSPVVLLGDSFCNVFSVAAMKWGDHAGLGEHLAMHLGRPIDVIAVNGGAPTATRRNLARYANIAVKKLVVWEFVTRELVDKTSEWEIVNIGEMKRSGSEEPIEVKAQVVAASKPPRPGEDPYAHCVIFTKYKVLSVEKGKYDEPELLTVQWVMRNFKLLPSANFKVGDVHHMVLVPFGPDLDPDLRQSKERDDTADAVHQPYWVVEMKGQ